MSEDPDTAHIAPESGGSNGPQGSETTRIGNYRITGEVGRGGMGVVLLGEHVSLGRPAAIKVLPPELAREEEFVARFVREARAAAQLDHPNVVRVYDAGRTGDSYYIAMELVPGHTLAQELDRAGPLSVERALEVTRSVALALAEAGRQSIIHRDVKPSNILIRDDGLVKLADLGLAKAIGSPGVTVSQTALGTPYYMAPEQARDPRSVDTRADLYSLGCTLYHMLTGAVPYTGTSFFTVMKAHESEAIPDPRQLRPDLPKPVAQLIRWTMAKDPDDRPASAEEVVTHVDRILRWLSGQAQTPPSLPAPRPAGRSRLGVALGPLRDPLLLVPLLLLAGMLVVGALLLLQGRKSASPTEAPDQTTPSQGTPVEPAASPPPPLGLEDAAPTEADPFAGEGPDGNQPLSPEQLDQAIARLEVQLREGVRDPNIRRVTEARLAMLKLCRALLSPDKSVREQALEAVRKEFRKKLSEGEYREAVVMFHYLKKLSEVPQLGPTLSPVLEQIAKRLFPAALDNPVTGSWQAQPLSKVVRDLSTQAGIAITFSREVGASERDRPVTLAVEGQPLRSVLLQVCRQAGLTYVVKDGGLRLARPRRPLRRLGSRVRQRPSARQ